jgi:hypothetical protein
LTLYQPSIVANIFGNWLNGVYHKFKKHIRLGAITIVWSIWLCRDDKLFNDKYFSLLQVIYRCVKTLCLRSSLQRVECRDLYMQVCSC